MNDRPGGHKSVLLLNLGGTIACGKTKAGLVPRLTAADLLEKTVLPARTTVDAVDLLKRTIVFPKDWVTLGTHIYAHRVAYDGFVITLGTDTLAHVSSALSLMIRNLGKPVVLTGAMSPITAARSDARRNLAQSLRVARTGTNGVFVVFDGRIMDGGSVTKVRSDAPNAFESINAPDLGRFSGSRLAWHYKPRASKRKPSLETQIDDRVALWKLAPQTTPSMLKVSRGCRGIVVEGYGDGNVPNNLVPSLERVTQEKVLVLTTQCPYGAVAHQYEGGAALIKAGAISAGKMTTELAMARLMMALGRSPDRNTAKRLFRTRH